MSGSESLYDADHARLFGCEEYENEDEMCETTSKNEHTSKGDFHMVLRTNSLKIRMNLFTLTNLLPKICGSKTVFKDKKSTSVEELKLRLNEEIPLTFW